MPARGPDGPLRLPQLCSACGDRPAAWTKPRVDFCYECLPGGPLDPPPCSVCGSPTDYFSQGRCIVCHPKSPDHPGSCRHCLAWGVYPPLQLDVQLVPMVAAALSRSGLRPLRPSRSGRDHGRLSAVPGTVAHRPGARALPRCRGCDRRQPAALLGQRGDPQAPHAAAQTGARPGQGPLNARALEPARQEQAALSGWHRIRR